MIQTLIQSILPVLFTVVVGYFAGAIHSFKKGAPSIINTAVMSYALPLSLFWTLNQLPLSVIVANWHIAFWLTIFMLAWWIITFFVSMYVGKSSVRLSAIRALAISTPADLFVGPSLLGTLYPKTVGLDMSMAGLVMFVVMFPLTFIVLAFTETNSSASTPQKVFNAFLKGLKTPVCWSAIVGLISSILNLHLPVIFEGTFLQLGKAAAGLGLFSIGLILYFAKPSLSKAVWFNVLTKEILVPISAFSVLLFVNEPGEIVNQVSLLMAISELVFPTILSTQYNEGTREMSSSMFLSTVVSIFVLVLIIVIRGITI